MEFGIDKKELTPSAGCKCSGCNAVFKALGFGQGLLHDYYMSFYLGL